MSIKKKNNFDKVIVKTSLRLYLDIQGNSNNNWKSWLYLLTTNYLSKIKFLTKRYQIWLKKTNIQLSTNFICWLLNWQYGLNLQNIKKCNYKTIICFLTNWANLSFIQAIKNQYIFRFQILSDITATDKNDNFNIIYNFVSVALNFRIILIRKKKRYNNISKKYHNLVEVESLAALYNSSNWLEREVWDMFGIRFLHHPDLRRILTDYGFEGFPLRKNYPLTGYLEVRYDEEYKSIVYEPVELAQEYRIFDFQSPWLKSKEFNIV